MEASILPNPKVGRGLDTLDNFGDFLTAVPYFMIMESVLTVGAPGLEDGNP